MRHSCDQESAHLARAEIPDVGNRVPGGGGVLVVHAAHQRIHRDEAGRCCRVRLRGYDIDRRDLGSCRTHGIFDGVFEGDRRRWAALAAARELEADHRPVLAVCHLEQRDIAAVRTQVRPDTVEGILDPALQAVRVKPVYEHETGDEFVGGEPIDQFGGRLGGDGDDPLERSPVEVGQLGGELFGPLTHDRAAARAGVQQGLDSITC